MSVLDRSGTGRRPSGFRNQWGLLASVASETWGRRVEVDAWEEAPQVHRRQRARLSPAARTHTHSMIGNEASFLRLLLQVTTNLQAKRCKLTMVIVGGPRETGSTRGAGEEPPPHPRLGSRSRGIPGSRPLPPSSKPPVAAGTVTSLRIHLLEARTPACLGPPGHPRPPIALSAESSPPLAK